jgi:hypothetical protein
MRFLGTACVIVAFASLAGCGGVAAAGRASGSGTTAPSRGDPPAWLMEEAAWQALSAGAAHSLRCDWTMTSLSRAASGAGAAGWFVEIKGAHSHARVYVVTIRGRFTAGPGSTAKSSTLCLILRPDRYVLALRLVDGRVGLRRLGAVHSFATTTPATDVWGHTMFEGGPAPGGPLPIANVAVGIWRGASSSGAPWRTVRSDGDGFFALALVPGAYTFRLLATDHGFPMASTVSVTAGRTVAVGVYGQAP